jgi:hypothetical protein
LRKVLMPSFGAHVLGLEPDESVPSMHIPPLIPTKLGWDLDLTSLLLFDKVIIDSLSVEFSKAPLHRRVRESIAWLADEGIAEIVDYGRICAKQKKELADMDASEAKDPSRWHEAAREAVIVWKNYGERLQASGVENRYSLGIVRFLQAQGGPSTSAEAQRLENLALSRSRSKERKMLLNVIAETYLKVVNLNLVLGRETNSTVLDWSNIDGFYRAKLLNAGRSPELRDAHYDRIRELFDSWMPDFPSDIKHFSKLIRDPRIVHLRALIDEAVRNGQHLDQQFWRRSFDAFYEKEKKVKAWRKRVALLSLPLLAVPHGGHFLREALADTAETIAKRSLHAGHKWLVMLMENNRSVGRV